MKQIKYFLCIALAIAMILSMAVTAAAADLSGFDPDRSASIGITLSDGYSYVVGAQVSVYRVAEFTIENNGLGYSYIDRFASCGLELNDVHDRDLAMSMYSHVILNGILPTATQLSDIYGYVYFGDLEPGIYLIAQTNSVAGFTAFTPFLTYLPVTEGDKWIYDLNATPKIDIDSVWTPPPPPPPPQFTTTPQVTTTTELTTTEATTTTEETTTEETTTEETTSSEETTSPEVTTTPYSSNEEPSQTTRNPHDDDSGAGAAGDRFRDDDSGAGAAGDRLVQTGQLNWPIPILAGTGSALIALGAIMRLTGRKRENGDK